MKKQDRPLMLAFQQWVPNYSVCMLEYGPEGEEGHDEDEVKHTKEWARFHTDILHDAILVWGKEKGQEDAKIIPFFANAGRYEPATFLKAYHFIPSDWRNTIHTMHKYHLQNMGNKCRYDDYGNTLCEVTDFTKHDVGSICRLTPGTPFLWMSSRYGTFLEILSQERTIEGMNSQRYRDNLIDDMHNGGAYQMIHYIGVKEVGCWHYYYYDGKTLSSVDNARYRELYCNHIANCIEQYKQQTA